MTLAEQREKLIELLDDAIGEQWYPAELLATISAAGFSIVGPEVTAEMVEAGITSANGETIWVSKRFKAMLAAGDLARKP